MTKVVLNVQFDALYKFFFEGLENINNSDFIKQLKIIFIGST